MNENPTGSEKNEVALVAVLVLNWNGRSLLQNCLPPLINQTYETYKIVLVDNASTDDSVSWMRQHYPQIQIIQNDENLGFSRGINAGLRQVSADVVVLLNNDVVVQPNWLEELIRPFAQAPSIGIIGCKLLFPDGTIQHLGAELTYPLANSHHFHYKEQDSSQITDLHAVPYVTGASMAIRREVLDKIGLLDESFHPFYYEEVDFCTRAHAAGFQVMVAPSAVAVHDESATVDVVSGLKLEAFHKNRLRYILKHYTLTQILDDFVPAEADYLAQHPILSETNALRLVYFEMAIPRPPISPNATAKEVTAVQTALLHLRRTSITTQVKNQPAPASLTEFEFPHTGSGIGWLASQLRRAWSSIAAKWLVRSLTQQQNEHNRYFLRRIEHLSNQAEIQTQETERLLAELLSAQQKQRELEAELADLRARHSPLATGVTRPS